MIDLNLTTAIAILNINSLNTPIKRLSDWIKKQNLTRCYQQEVHFKDRHNYAKRSMMENDIPC